MAHDERPGEWAQTAPGQLKIDYIISCAFERGWNVSLWPDADDFVPCNKSSGIWGTPVVSLTQSGRQPVTQERHSPVKLRIAPIAVAVIGATNSAPVFRSGSLSRRSIPELRGGRFGHCWAAMGKMRPAPDRPSKIAGQA
jgi:hypothetical protein